eukprot:Pgem_evm1s3835
MDMALKTMKTTMLDPNEVDKTIDDWADLIAKQNDIDDALTRIGDDLVVDEDELLTELNSLTTTDTITDPKPKATTNVSVVKP